MLDRRHHSVIWSGNTLLKDSKLYGKLKPGFFMPQSKALEAGYRPPFNETCR
jgi:hypothetical protein